MMGQLDLTILRKLRKAPMWSQSLRSAKPVVTRLINAGYAKRVAPEGGKTRNMVAITDKGENYLEKIDGWE